MTREGGKNWLATTVLTHFQTWGCGLAHNRLVVEDSSSKMPRKRIGLIIEREEGKESAAREREREAYYDSEQVFHATTLLHMSEAKLFGCKALRQLAIPRDSRPPCRDAIHWPGKNRLKERGKTTDAVRNLCAAWLAILMINPRLFSVIIHSSDGIQLVCMCVGGWLCNFIVFIFPSFGLVREKI